MEKNLIRRTHKDSPLGPQQMTREIERKDYIYLKLSIIKKLKTQILNLSTPPSPNDMYIELTSFTFLHTAREEVRYAKKPSDPLTCNLDDFSTFAFPCHPS